MMPDQDLSHTFTQVWSRIWIWYSNCMLHKCEPQDACWWTWFSDKKKTIQAMSFQLNHVIPTQTSHHLQTHIAAQWHLMSCGLISSSGKLQACECSELWMMLVKGDKLINQKGLPEEVPNRWTNPFSKIKITNLWNRKNSQYSKM